MVAKIGSKTFPRDGVDRSNPFAARLEERVEAQKERVLIRDARGVHVPGKIIVDESKPSANTIVPDDELMLDDELKQLIKVHGWKKLNETVKAMALATPEAGNTNHGDPKQGGKLGISSPKKDGTLSVDRTGTPWAVRYRL